MRLHIKNLSPEVHGLIAQHKAEHNHKNLKDTIECIVKNTLTIEEMKIIFAAMDDYIQSDDSEVRRIAEQINKKLRIS